MINKNDLINIGKFQKTHALKGEMNALIKINPEFLEQDYPLIVEIEGIPVPFYIENIRPKGNTSYLIKLEGIDDIEEAKQFINKEIYVDKKTYEDYRIENNEEITYFDNFEDYKIIDKRQGEIGRIIDIEDSTQNVLFIVESNGENFYVPAVEDFIEEIDDDKKIIKMNLPEGLLEIN